MATSNVIKSIELKQINSILENGSDDLVWIIYCLEDDWTCNGDSDSFLWFYLVIK